MHLFQKKQPNPGLDGFTIEFYRKFWKKLGPLLMEMYQFSFESGTLPESVIQGLISLLPKKQKDTRYIKNMRPLTLLNNDYKILAKAVDNRLREVLPSLIASDQTGFIKGRKIAHNIRKSIDIIDVAKKEKIPMVILSIDMEKCFDRLEHQAILESMKYFNFGPNFIKWVGLFYNNFQICTQNFGHLSPFWTKGRGCNQGCPLSPGIYLLTAEIMANKLRSNPEIKGVKIGNLEYLISQFADDTDLYLHFDQNTFDATFEVLTGIETNTGLRISYDKTTIYRIGSLAGTDAKLFTQKKIKWENCKINTLGVDLYNDSLERDQNIRDVINRMKSVSKMWYYRNMTLIGKVVVVNSLMSSLFVYKMQILPVLDPQLIVEIENVILEFLWRGKKPKIPLVTLKLSKEDGGLGLVDIERKHAALLFTWINDCTRFDEIRNLAVYFLGPLVHENRLWQFQLTTKDSEILFPGESFWHGLLYAWFDYSFHEPQSSEDVLNECIWYNSGIKVQGRPVKNLVTHEVQKIRDLRKDDRFLTYMELCQNHPGVRDQLSWIQYYSIIAAIPDRWKFYLNNSVNPSIHVPKYMCVRDNIKPSRWIYHDMIKSDKVLYRVSTHWTKIFGVNLDINGYRYLFQNINKLSGVVKLRNFQFRLLHNKIFCNNVLVHWKKTPTNICNLCNISKQDIVHLMFSCVKVRPIWNRLQALFWRAQIVCTFEPESIIFNTSHEDTLHIVNKITLIVKQFIYRCKCQDTEPSFIGAIAEIRLNYNIEKSISCVEKVKRLWRPVIQCLKLPE